MGQGAFEKGTRFGEQFEILKCCQQSEDYIFPDVSDLSSLFIFPGSDRVVKDRPRSELVRIQKSFQNGLPLQVFMVFLNFF